MNGLERLGICLNTGHCGRAGEGTPIHISADAPFVCPECHRELVKPECRAKMAEAEKKTRKVPRMLLLSVLLLGLLATIGIRYDLVGLGASGPPALATGNGGILQTPPGNVRTGTSIVTYDDLTPMLWRSFLLSQGCPEVDRSSNPPNTIIVCANGADPRVTVSPPTSALNMADTAMKSFDVLLTTDPAFATALPGTRPVAADAQGNVAHADVIGVDALAVVVNPANPLARLSQPQLARIFLGRTTDFADVGGRPGRIRVVAPAADPRADDRLKAIVPQWLPLAPTAQRLASSDAIIAAVLADPAAIGIVERRAATALKTLAIGPAAGQAVAPTALALISGDYPLARPVRAVRFNHDDSPYETSFVAFARTEPARAAITAAGFEPIRSDSFASAIPAVAPPAYTSVVAGNRRIAPDSVGLEPQSSFDLDTLADRLTGEGVNGSRLRIIGLSDPGRPDAAADADRLARQIATLLAERGLDATTAIGIGGAMPVAEPGAANRNRRVELWISPESKATTSAFP
jgi:phosphate transport system substrate-binding protein